MPRILLVDDSKFDLMFAERLLARVPEWEVRTATDGTEAVEFLKQNSCDLIISDVRMPRMDGLALLGHVRKQHPQIPVVIVTSFGSEEVAMRALRQGAASYVSKQHLEASLAEAIESVLAASDGDRQRRALLSQVTRHSLEIRLPNDRKQIPVTVSYLQELGRSLGVIGDSDAVQFGVALEESLVNAIVHGNLEVSSDLKESGQDHYEQMIAARRVESPYQERRVTIDALFTCDMAEITIRDEGPGFDVAALPDPRDPENLLRASGRGLLLVRAFMDRVTFNDEGNAVTIVKRRRSDADASGSDDCAAANSERQSAAACR
ncbi:MAG: response regulator [Planctomycetaceae bacterium]